MAKRYSADDKTQALASLGVNAGDLSKTSVETGIPVETLRRWSRGGRVARVNGHDTSEDEASPSGGAGVPDAAEPAGAAPDSLRGLQTLLLQNASAIAGSLAEAVDAAPLNQRAQALGLLVDKILKLETWLRAAGEAAEQQIISFEFRYPDGSVHDVPPWEQAQPAPTDVWSSRWDADDDQPPVD